MASNLFIAYDLMSPGQNYEKVRDAIKSLGQWHQFQLSLFYVHTPLDAHQAYAAVSRTMDGNDRLAVINCTEAVVTNWDHPPVDTINSIWFTS